METTFDLRARLLHISEEQQRDEERETESSASGSSASTPADRLRQRLSRTAPSIRLETPDQPQVPFELEVLAEEMVATPRRIQTVPEAHPLADDEVRGLLAEEREPPAREGEQAGVGVARTPEPSPPRVEAPPPRHARLSDVTPESVLAALLPLWAAGDGTTFRQLCPPASTVRVRAAKTFATLLNLSAKKQLWLEQENGRHYGEIFIHQTTARSQA
ncbi:uncharacterized protein LOC134537214 [Bacillus rossius redtenbacheri]|uniref:uncharacterized protein LOC134537214 n=1 Tax=Bacillus rossius redtenbacheri TaxID=93214 RepID=UPI002FDCB7D5